MRKIALMLFLFSTGLISHEAQASAAKDKCKMLNVYLEETVLSTAANISEYKWLIENYQKNNTFRDSLRQVIEEREKNLQTAEQLSSLVVNYCIKIHGVQ